MKGTASWLSVWKKWCLEKEIVKEIENYESTQLSTLLVDSTPKLKTNMVKPGKRRNETISSKVIRTLTEQFLELFSRTLNFFAPWRCEDIIAYYCFDRTRLFWPTARFEWIIFALDARALLVLNFDKPSRIFPSILLILITWFFLVQFWINKSLLIFSKTTNCIRPTGSCNFVSLWKNLLVLIYSKLHSKSCDYL